MLILCQRAYAKWLFFVFSKSSTSLFFSTILCKLYFAYEEHFFPYLRAGVLFSVDAETADVQHVSVSVCVCEQAQNENESKQQCAAKSSIATPSQ